ncbi:MAG: histidine kinase [Bacteroidetes bacterium B1(2017)]|nr:MAG: histidine kinase [Bacteroidetes bacterium B1(2017)]
MKNRFWVLWLFIFTNIPVWSQSIVQFGGKKELIISQTRILIDTSCQKSFHTIKADFASNKGFTGKLDIDYVKYPIWIKVEVENKSASKSLMFIFENPLIDSIDYFLESDSINPSVHNYLGNGFNAREHRGTFQKFDIHLAQNEKATYYFKVRGNEQMLLPLSLSTESDAIQNNNLRDLIYGAFIGVVLVMLFYNLFVFASTKDRNYLYYVLYILFIGLGQISLSGHLFSLIIGNSPALYKSCIVVLPALSGIFAILFIKQFLQAKQYEPNLDKALSVIAVSYGLAAIIRIFGQTHISARMMDVIGLPGAALVFVLAFRVYKKGLKSASYFIAAWSIFIVGVVMFVFRNLSVLPFTWATTYTLPLGASFEVALLSFALADKINTLQAQKREKEKEALMSALENERLIKEQNVVLEQKVLERTLELENSNTQLNTTLYDLKSTQSQLVDQEKMASLGQLTAGIAHEINNPINFVTSNINPLKRDIKMIQDLMGKLEELTQQEISIEEKKAIISSYKNEIDYDYLQEELNFLLKGIDEGAHRTAEIVKGLRIFARNDEDSILNTDIVEGIESTLVILNNQFGKIVIEKKYSEPVLIDCYPGKLNQVFLNLISNSLFAIHAKFGENIGGRIGINLTFDKEFIYLSFEDNGIGMSEAVQKRVFEPFFTTKPVGQGTGLGMSIVFKTIETHKGKISVKSTEGEGTSFEIQLNRSLIFNNGNG